MLHIEELWLYGNFHTFLTGAIPKGLMLKANGEYHDLWVQDNLLIIRDR